MEAISHAVAQKAVQTAFETLGIALNASSNLDNETGQRCEYILEGDASMKRIRERITVNGEQIWITGSSMQELFEKASELLNPQQAKIAPINLTNQSGPTFDEYKEEWMRLYKKDKVRPTTFRTYSTLLTKNISPYFGNINIADIKTSDIQSFYNSIDHLAKSSIRQISVVLNQIFDSAIEDGLIDKNPAKSSRLSYSGKKTTRAALSNEDWKDIIAQLPKLDTDDRLLIAIMLYTGMRRGEVLALRWKNIDFEKKEIHVMENVTFGNGNGGMVGPPKSKAGYRMIPLVDDLSKLLTPGIPDHFVLGGDQHYTESKFDRSWQRISKTIDLHGATPHILRHTYLTIMGGTDTDVKTIQAIAGHADIKTTMDRYVHKQNDRIHLAGIKMQEIFTSY